MKKKGYAMGGMKKKGYAAGGLKTPGAGQTGLKKLPKEVRNKMGYMNKGGMPKKKDMKGMGMYGGGMSMKKKGMANGGAMMKKKGYSNGGVTTKGGARGGRNFPHLIKSTR